MASSRLCGADREAVVARSGAFIVSQTAARISSTLPTPFLNGLFSFQVCQLVFQFCDGFFSIAYPLLNFALLLFGFPLGFQIAVIRNLSDLLLDCLLAII